MNCRPLYIASLLLMAVSVVPAQDPLEICYRKQVAALEGNRVALNYTEVRKRHYHSFEPWQHFSTMSTGQVMAGEGIFIRHDTVKRNERIMAGHTQWTYDALLVKGASDTAFRSVTEADHQDMLIESARYSPIPLIGYFHKHKEKIVPELWESGTAYYTMKLNKTLVGILFQGERVNVVITKDHHELHGDVLTGYTYAYDSRNLPVRTTINKLHDLEDEVTVLSSEIVASQAKLPTPEFFVFKVNTESPESKKVTIGKYNDRIHYVEFAESDSRSLIVEFADFLTIVEAPLNTRIGEQIIAEAKKIAPRKPIRYFTFSHHHPHYIGGVRAMVHEGAEIITIAEDTAYLRRIVTAKRTLQPDILSKEPKDLKELLFRDSMTIRNGEMEMRIYLMGSKSKHAMDFLVYYFPKERMLFQGELVWIDKDKPLVKAGERQVAMYEFIQELGLPVKTIVQSWPLVQYNVKSTIMFDELERSITSPIAK